MLFEIGLLVCLMIVTAVSIKLTKDVAYAEGYANALFAIEEETKNLLELKLYIDQKAKELGAT